MGSAYNSKIVFNMTDFTDMLFNIILAAKSLGYGLIKFPDIGDDITRYLYRQSGFIDAKIKALEDDNAGQ
jgi:hypothetical protein